MWFWLARIIRGRSQQVSTRRGVERESVAMYGLRQCQPVSEKFLSSVRLIKATIRLWRRVVDHSSLIGVSQMVGINIRVGIRIFSIVVGLGFGGDQSRGYGQWLLVGRVLRLLRKQRMLIRVLVWGINW